MIIIMDSFFSHLQFVYGEFSKACSQRIGGKYAECACGVIDVTMRTKRFVFDQIFYDLVRQINAHTPAQPERKKSNRCVLL